ncbi:MAG: helix-turn-helix transcriptional regulator [Pseudomonadota bacterium]
MTDSRAEHAIPDASLSLDQETIGERIKSARKERRLSQTDLAQRAGVSQPAVANWEAGVHDPRRLVIVKIADVLEVDADWLANGERSTRERDKHPAAAYIRRPIQHTPIISLADAARFFGKPPQDPHMYAEDYIPVTSAADKVFAIFADDPEMNRAFPKNTLVVIDYADRRPTDGSFCLINIEDGWPKLRRWRQKPSMVETVPAQGEESVSEEVDPTIVIGCVRVSIRFH